MSFTRLSSKSFLTILFFALSCNEVVAACADGEYETEVGACYQSWTGPLGEGFYTIAVPQGWTPSSGLVFWNHGFESYTQGLSNEELVAKMVAETLFPSLTTEYLDQVQAEPGLGPFAKVVLAQGYAMAASSYTQTGWAVFDTELSNELLYAKFLEVMDGELGFSSVMPAPFYIVGASLGGIVTMKDLELGLLPQVDGALLACGVVAGSANWSHAFDIRMITESVCQGAGAERLPAPWYQVPDAQELDMALGLNECVALGSRLATETASNGLLREIEDIDARLADSPSLPEVVTLNAERVVKVAANQQLWDLWEESVNPNQIANYASIQALTDTFSTQLFALDMWYGTFALPRLIQDPGKLNGINPFHNAGIEYSDAAVNDTVQRAIALPSHRQELLANYTPTGNIGSTRIVSIHTSGDGLVQVENQKFLEETVNAAQLTTGVVVESIPSHCAFTESEAIAAWNELQAWVETDAQPSTQDLQSACEAIVQNSENGVFLPDWNRAPDAGLHSDLRCRIDPSFDSYGELLDFPRSAEAPAAAPAEFDGNTNVLELKLAQVLGESDTHDADLVWQGLVDGYHEFSITNLSEVGSASAWIHSSQYDPLDGLLYVPEVILRNLPPAYAVHEGRVVDIFFQYLGNDRFRLLETDPPLN